ncbi:MAG: hypothetical protein ACFUZC_12470 [Chthoniobacteraceae bacterium]
MKILIVEEALRGLKGHWFQYVSDIVNGGLRMGHQIEVAVHKDACHEILVALPCRPILNETAFDGRTAPARGIKRIKRIIGHNRSLYHDLSSLLAAGNSYDVIIATTVRIDHLLAYLWLLWRFRGRGFGKLVLLFIESVGRYTSNYSQLHFSAKSYPLKVTLILCRLLMRRYPVFLVTESQGLARQYEQLCGINFPIVPHVTTLPPWNLFKTYKHNVSTNPDPPLILSTFGFTRFDKGLDILQDAIRILGQRDARRKMRFILQWTGDYRLPSGARIHRDPQLLRDPFVQYIPAFSSSRQYYEQLANTDIIVMPYRRAFYFDKLSRVAIDAALAGVPFVYPAGTWLESFANIHGSGVAFQEEDPVSLADAISEVVATFAEIKSKAETRQQTVASAFSAKAFFDRIESFQPTT